MTIRYNEDLDPNEGPGFGCFIWQAILFAGILLLIPVGVFTFGWPVWLLATLMFIDLFLLFFVSMTSVFLLRVFFADRRGSRGRQTGVAKRPPRVISTEEAAADEPSEPTPPPMTDEQPTRQHTMVGVWTAIGIGVGTSLGVALNGVGVGVLLGLVIGLAIGIGLDRARGNA